METAGIIIEVGLSRLLREEKGEKGKKKEGNDRPRAPAIPKRKREKEGEGPQFYRGFTDLFSRVRARSRFPRLQKEKKKREKKILKSRFSTNRPS